MHANVLISIKP